MLKEKIESKLATYLSVGTFAVTVFLLTGTSTDPVNVTKLFALGGVSIAVGFISLIFGRKQLIQNFKPLLLMLLIFDLALILATLGSKSPLSQNIFGTFGRNCGLLTYLLLSFVTASSLLISKLESFTRMIYALFAAGLVNVLYCAWVLVFGDFIPWNNPYGNILGLFGNPDFVSAFLGIFIAAALAFIVTSETKRVFRLLLGLAVAVALYEIVKSHAIQGLVVTAGGIAIVGFYSIRSIFKRQSIAFGYVVAVSVLGIVAIMGTLQKGPLSFVYKRSVSFRGTYWRAGLEMGKNHPFTGVGLDTYGDWYRRARPPIALIDTPGISTMSNVSHNVVIDFFASGGFPLLLSYLAMIAVGIFSIAKVTVRAKKFDRVFVGMTAAWLGYQVQSFISINQIGLAIWGWLFTGLLVAYEHSTRIRIQNADLIRGKSDKGRVTTHSNVISPQLVGGIGMVIGLLLVLPPLSADTKWYSATRSHDVAKVEAALVPSYFNPADSFRYAQAVDLFQTSNFPDLAHKYAITAVKFNPDYFDAWKGLYLLPKSSEAEKAQALANMKRLDPKNPDVTAN